MELDADHYLPLHRAVLTKRVENVCEAIRQHARADALDYLRQSPLLLATKHRLTDIMKALLHNASCEIADQARNTIATKDASGKTALMYAIQNKDFVATAMLVMSGADINTCDTLHKWTPLILATFYGHKWLVRHLLKQPILQINAADDLGRTALHTALGLGQQDIVTLLLQRIDIAANAVDVDGKTALISGVHRHHVWGIHRLLDSKLAHVNHLDEGGYTALYYAFEGNHTDIATVLVKRGGASLQFKCPLTNTTLLMMACKHGNKDLVELCASVDIDAVDIVNRSALYYACEYPALVALLLARNADRCGKDLGGKTTLMRAAQLGSTDVIMQFIELYRNKGDNLSLCRRDHEDRSALAHACMGGHVDAVKCLVLAGACLTFGDVDGNTPLMLAARQGYQDVVDVLVLSMKRGINDVCKRGRTALATAVLMHHPSTARALLKGGASSQIPDENGVTPLMRACQRQFTCLVRILLEHDDTDIDARGECGLTALGYACGEEHNAECVRLLLKHNADPGVLTICTGTALHEACTIQNSLESVELLLQAMTIPQINQQNEDGYTGLHYACQFELLEVAVLLLERGADPFKVTFEDNTTPLMLAAAANSLEIVEVLVQKMGRSGLDSVDEDGCTALYSAAEKHHWDVVSMLLDNGADATIPTEENDQTILDHAIETGCLAIVAEVVMSVKNPTDRCRFVNSPTRDLMTPLHVASKEGHMDMVEFLITQGARQYVANIYGCTPLYYAMSTTDIIDGDVELVERALLRSSTLSEVNHVNVHGRTVLSCAIERMNTIMVEMLIRYGASLDPILANGNLWTDTDYPSTSVEVMRLVTDDLNMDVNARDPDGKTALFLVAGWEDEKDSDQCAIVQHLLSRGANPWLTAEDGVLPIDVCQNASVRLLLKSSMDEPLRFRLLDTARTLFHMHERIELTSYGSTTRHAKRLKSIPEEERLLLDKKLPTYSVKKTTSSPSLIDAVLNEVFGLNDDVFEELFDMMKPIWQK